MGRWAAAIAPAASPRLCPGARGVRGAVLSVRAAGGLSVRERPGPPQWLLSAGPFVQEAATPLRGWAGRAGQETL